MQTLQEFSGLPDVSCKMKVLAVVVTFNRVELLSRCIEYIQRQKRAPEQILVINNGSTDSTEQMLVNRGVHCVTQPNLGSAGGWHAGIKYALDHDFDAVWLMDDDGFPDPDALAVLESALLPSVACASSVVLCEDKLDHFVFSFPVLGEEGFPVILDNPRNFGTLTELRAHAKDGKYPFAHLFNGALISVAAIRNVGNINPDYFIYGDEVDYFFRLRKAGTVISVLKAKHYHPDVSMRPLTIVKVYYYVKNSLVLNKMYFNAVWIRHTLLICSVLGRVGSRNGIGFVLSLLIGRNALVLYSAIFRGLKGKVGKDFDG